MLYRWCFKRSSYWSIRYYLGKSLRCVLLKWHFVTFGHIYIIERATKRKWYGKLRAKDTYSHYINAAILCIFLSRIFCQIAPFKTLKHNTVFSGSYFAYDLCTGAISIFCIHCTAVRYYTLSKWYTMKMKSKVECSVWRLWNMEHSVEDTRYTRGSLIIASFCVDTLLAVAQP